MAVAVAVAAGVRGRGCGRGRGRGCGRDRGQGPPQRYFLARETVKNNYGFEPKFSDLSHPETTIFPAFRSKRKDGRRAGRLCLMAKVGLKTNVGTVSKLVFLGQGRHTINKNRLPCTQVERAEGGGHFIFLMSF